MTTPTEDGDINKPTPQIITVIMDWTDEEEAIIHARAARLGLTPEDYIRTRLGLLPFRMVR